MATALRGEINSRSQSFLWKPLRPQGRVTYLRVGDPSSFSIPVGICGAARLIQAFSCGSGRSSQRKTGSGFEASSARARNDSFLISGAADPSLLWGNGPGQRDRGEPGFGPHSPSAAGDWWGGARSPPSGHSEPPGGGRPRRSAPRSLALLSTPRPTRRTLKRLPGALLNNASRSPHGGR